MQNVKAARALNITAARGKKKRRSPFTVHQPFTVITVMAIFHDSYIEHWVWVKSARVYYNYNYNI